MIAPSPAHPADALDATPQPPSRLGRAWRQLSALPAGAALLLIRLYQRTLSPALPVFLGPTCGCRFTPTCSHYTADAIRAHGVIIGIGLGAIRLLKCTPLHPGGHDPVPPRRPRPVCRQAVG